MKSEKVFKISITILLLSSALKATTYCGQNCISCKSPGECSTCLDRKIDPATKMCNTAPADPSRNCKIWSTFMGKSFCSFCKESYSEDYGSDRCSKTTQDLGNGCLSSMNYKGAQVCKLCQGGVPDFLTGSCVSKDLLPEGYWVHGCVVGKGQFSEGRPELVSCFKCGKGMTFLGRREFVRRFLGIIVWCMMNACRLVCVTSLMGMFKLGRVYVSWLSKFKLK